MGQQNVLAPRSVRRVNREHGTDFLHASINQDGRSILGMRPGGRYYWLDRYTGQLEPSEFAGTSQQLWYPNGTWAPL